MSVIATFFLFLLVLVFFIFKNSSASYAQKFELNMAEIKSEYELAEKKHQKLQLQIEQSKPLLKKEIDILSTQVMWLNELNKK